MLQLTDSEASFGALWSPQPVIPGFEVRGRLGPGVPSSGCPVLEDYLRFIVSPRETRNHYTRAQESLQTPQGPTSVHVRGNHLQCPLPAACLQGSQDSRKNGRQ